MKKIIFTFLVLIFNINFTYADTCTIANKTSPELLEYITNNRLIVSEITNQTLTASSSDSSTYDIEEEATEFFSNVKSTSLAIYNEAFNYTGYNSYFRYYATYPIANDIPYEVRRDYELLAAENDGLKEYIDTIRATGKDNVDIISICDQVDSDTSCTYDNSIKNTKLIGELIYNNDKILDLYRKSVMGDVDKNPDNYEYQLVPTNFESEITTDYSIKNYGNCSEETGFFAAISESIKNIGTLNQEAEDGIAEWKNAWKLLMGTDDTKAQYQELEKELLKNELSRQGITGDSQQAMLESLDKYNSPGGFSLKNRFFDSTFDRISSSVMEQFNDFEEEAFGDIDFGDDIEAPSLEDVNNAVKNSDKTLEIAEKVNTLYVTQSAYEGISEYNTSKTRTRIVKMYENISNAINTLSTSTCPVSVNVCESQDGDKGDCGKCN